jgi:hypothetical protein
LTEQWDLPNTGIFYSKDVASGLLYEYNTIWMPVIYSISKTVAIQNGLDFETMTVTFLQHVQAVIVLLPSIYFPQVRGGMGSEQ